PTRRGTDDRPDEARHQLWHHFAGLGTLHGDERPVRLGLADDGEHTWIGVAEAEGEDVGPAFPRRVGQALVGRLPAFRVVSWPPVRDEDDRRAVPPVAARPAGVIV